MKVISQKKQSGKTTELLNYLKYDERTILIVPTEAQAVELRRTAARHQDVDITTVANRIYSATKFAVESRGRIPADARLLFDELDSILAATFRGVPHRATITEA